MVASPMLVDPHFQQTVVLLLEHGVTGSMGVIINRPATWTLGELLSPAQRRWLNSVSLAKRRLISSGECWAQWGPFSGTQRILSGLAVGGDVAAMVTAGCSVRLFLGHAGWDANQLQQEIRHGYWHLHPGDAKMALAATADVTWWEELVHLPVPLSAPNVN